MEILETFAWVTLGFVPTLVAMEAAWKLSAKIKYRRKEVILANVR